MKIVECWRLVPVIVLWWVRMWLGWFWEGVPSTGLIDLSKLIFGLGGVPCEIVHPYSG